MDRNSSIRKRTSLLCLMDIVLCFMACGLYMRLHFSVDGFDIWMDESAAFHRMLRDGRPFGCLLWMLNGVLPFHPIRDSGIYVGVFIALSGVLAGCMTQRLMKYMRYTPAKLFIVNMGVLLTFVNGFINDWYGFPESMFSLYIPSMFFAFLAVAEGEKEGTLHKGLSLLFLIISYNSYPVVIGYYVFYMLLIIWLQQGGRINRKSIGGVLTALVSVMMTAISNVLLMKVIAPNSPRYAQISIGNLPETAFQVSRQALKTLIDSNNQLPEYLFLSVLVMLTGIALAGLALAPAQEGKRKRIEQMLSLCIVLAGGILCVYVPHLLTVPVWITNRTVVALFSVFAVLAAVIAFSVWNRLVEYTVAAVLTVFMLFNVYSVQNAAQELFAANAMQQNMALQIQEEIKDYEEASGVKVKYIGFVDDLYPSWIYPFATQTYCEQIPNSYTVSWNRLDCLNYYTGQQYEEIAPPDDIRIQFSGKNWDVFEADEQILYDGDIVYICVY